MGEEVVENVVEEVVEVEKNLTNKLMAEDKTLFSQKQTLHPWPGARLSKNACLGNIFILIFRLFQRLFIVYCLVFDNFTKSENTEKKN